jgi:FecR protein
MFPTRYFLTFLAFSISLLITVAHALPAVRIPRTQASKPRETRVPVFGFLLQGGVVNYLEGEVRCECAGIGGERVQKGRELVNGDLLKTGTDARAEILLNPGYYLRLGPNSRLVLQDLSRNNLKVKLVSGTALLEVLINDSRGGYTDTGMSKIGTSSKIYEFVTLTTPNDEYLVSEGGAYRFGAEGNGVSSVKVISGHIAIAGKTIGE